MTDSSVRDDIPALVRPSPELARKVARAFFVRGVRVDMQSVSEKLGVGRTTLYRWVGGREALLAEVLAELAEATWQMAESKAKGSGVDRAIDVLGSFMIVCAEFDPLREFAVREPQLTLRLARGPNSPLPKTLSTLIGGLAEDCIPAFEARRNYDIIDAIVEVMTALPWASFVIGEEPSIERVLQLSRALLENRLNCAQKG